MSTMHVKKKKEEQPLITLEVRCLKGEGDGLKDAYRILARKVLEAKKCAQRSISG